MPVWQDLGKGQATPLFGGPVRELRDLDKEVGVSQFHLLRPCLPHVGSVVEAVAVGSRIW